MDLLFLPLLFLLMWFLLIRPQQTRLRRQRELITSLSVGDEVVTAGGIIGTIRVLGDEELWVEVSPGVEVRLLRAAISSRRAASGLAPPAGEEGQDEDRPDEER